MKYRISVREARHLVLSNAPSARTVTLALGASHGRTLRHQVRTAEALPPFDNSAMDGYAVRSADCQVLPVTLAVQETIHAGDCPTRPVGHRQCAAIMTGAPMPAGADVVVPVEWTVEAGVRQVQIERVSSVGTYVRRAGRDAQAGMAVALLGTVITPPVVGLLAAAGARSVVVSRRPRVAVVTTGNELYRLPGPLPFGKIRDISGAALPAQIWAAGGKPLGPFHANDTVADTRRALAAALEAADAVLVCGGVSVGRRDLVRQVLDGMGFDMIFWRVRQRPGGPLAFGGLGEVPIFGLPGNPVSTAVCFDQYVRPFLASMLGRAEVHRPRMHALLSAPMPKVRGLHVFARGHCFSGADAVVQVQDTGPQASNLIASWVGANCIIHLEEEMETAFAGATVEVELLHWPPGRQPQTA